MKVLMRMSKHLCTSFFVFRLYPFPDPDRQMNRQKLIMTTKYNHSIEYVFNMSHIEIILKKVTLSR
uniref:Uncharacterized protein n=1 Tax=Erwinia amylovora TaxID=552 RepID=A0A0P0ZGX6_ERWAM|nr:hypothetical protein EAMY692_p10008 [Erwinia amylovora]